MTRIKIISSIAITTILLATQIFVVGAAPAQQETTPITGTVLEIVLDTDPDTGMTTVLVTLDVGAGTTQIVRLDLADAASIGLVNEDGTVNPDTEGKSVDIDPSLVIPDSPEEEELHPVGSALSDFFTDLLGVDYEMIMDYHDEGIGFGVIAQALWMTNSLDGDSDTFAAILEAKQNHDYSGITLPDGNTPENWGQFRKAVLKDKEKAKQNLGVIMSGHAEDTQGEDIQAGPQGNGPQNNGNGPDKDKDNKGKNEDKGKDKDKDKGKNN